MTHPVLDRPGPVPGSLSPSGLIDKMGPGIEPVVKLMVAPRRHKAILQVPGIRTSNPEYQMGIVDVADRLRREFPPNPNPDSRGLYDPVAPATDWRWMLTLLGYGMNPGGVFHYQASKTIDARFDEKGREAQKTWLKTRSVPRPYLDHLEWCAREVALRAKDERITAPVRLMKASTLGIGGAGNDYDGKLELIKRWTDGFSSIMKLIENPSRPGSLKELWDRFRITFAITRGFRHQVDHPDKVRVVTDWQMRQVTSDKKIVDPTFVSEEAQKYAKTKLDAHFVASRERSVATVAAAPSIPGRWAEEGQREALKTLWPGMYAIEDVTAESEVISQASAIVITDYDQYDQSIVPEQLAALRAGASSVYGQWYDNWHRMSHTAPVLYRADYYSDGPDGRGMWASGNPLNFSEFITQGGNFSGVASTSKTAHLTTGSNVSFGIWDRALTFDRTSSTIIPMKRVYSTPRALLDALGGRDGATPGVIVVVKESVYRLITRVVGDNIEWAFFKVSGPDVPYPQLVEWVLHICDACPWQLANTTDTFIGGRPAMVNNAIALVPTVESGAKVIHRDRDAGSIHRVAWDYGILERPAAYGLQGEAIRDIMAVFDDVFQRRTGESITGRAKAARDERYLDGLSEFGRAERILGRPPTPAEVRFITEPTRLMWDPRTREVDPRLLEYFTVPFPAEFSTRLARYTFGS